MEPTNIAATDLFRTRKILYAALVDGKNPVTQPTEILTLQLSPQRGSSWTTLMQQVPGFPYCFLTEVSLEKTPYCFVKTTGASLYAKVLHHKDKFRMLAAARRGIVYLIDFPAVYSRHAIIQIRWEIIPLLLYLRLYQECFETSILCHVPLPTDLLRSACDYLPPNEYETHLTSKTRSTAVEQHVDDICCTPFTLTAESQLPTGREWSTSLPYISISRLRWAIVKPNRESSSLGVQFYTPDEAPLQSYEIQIGDMEPITGTHEDALFLRNSSAQYSDSIAMYSHVFDSFEPPYTGLVTVHEGTPLKVRFTLRSGLPESNVIFFVDQRCRWRQIGVGSVAAPVTGASDVQRFTNNFAPVSPTMLPPSHQPCVDVRETLQFGIESPTYQISDYYKPSANRKHIIKVKRPTETLPMARVVPENPPESPQPRPGIPPESPQPLPGIPQDERMILSEPIRETIRETIRKLVGFLFS